MWIILKFIDLAFGFNSILRMKLSIFQFLHHRLKAMLDDPCILNWNNIQRCILMFGLFLLVKTFWILWKGYIYLTPEVQNFIHMPVMVFQLKVELTSFVVASIFIIILLYFSDRTDSKMDHYIPYFAVNLFALTLLFDAYCAGLFSPNTLANVACYVLMGYILFSPRVMGVVIALTSVCFGYLIYQTFEGSLSYGPIFNYETIGYPQYNNAFWLGSINYFGIPILVLSILILLLILKQWRERENYIAHLGHLDPLTGIYNRRMLNQQLAQLDQNKAEALHAIFMLDLDHFKQINDHYGHIVGDQVLEKVAEILKMNIRNSDILGRYGGEEFLILLKNINLEKAKEVAERCRAALHEINHEIAPDTVIKVSGSIGVAFIQDGVEAVSALNAADEALYKAKALGRNQICYAQF